VVHKRHGSSSSSSSRKLMGLHLAAFIPADARFKKRRRWHSNCMDVLYIHVGSWLG
jgi:hypothetical protein